MSPSERTWTAKGQGKVRPRQGRVVELEPPTLSASSGSSAPGDAGAAAALITAAAARAPVAAGPSLSAVALAALGQPPASAVQLDGVSHEDRLRGVRPDDPPVRYDRASLTDGGEAQVPKLRLDRPAEYAAALTRMREGLPVVLLNSQLLNAAAPGSNVPGLVGKWTFSHLSEAMGAYCTSWPVQCSAPGRRRFLPIDTFDGRNARAAPYHIREPETQTLSMDFRGFAQCAGRWTDRPVRLLATLMEEPGPVAADDRAEPPHSDRARTDAPAAAVGGPPALAAPAIPPLHPSVNPKLARMAARDLCEGLSWPRLSALLGEARLGAVTQVALDCGTRGSLLPAHAVEHDALQAQLVGRRRVLLLDPAQSYAGLYPYPEAHPYRSQAMVDLEAVDLGRWPLAARLRGLEVILEPGDILYLPAGWWRHVQQLEEQGSSLELALAPSRCAPAPARAVPRRLGAAIEARVAAAEGPVAVRHWLSVIAAGEEDEWIDLSTVAGARRVQMVQQLRDEADAQLGAAGAWRTFLPALLDRRLEPTPWLNTAYREPLYLTDTPKQLPDERTEAQRAFPELFRAALSQQGYEVAPSPVSVLNPHHPNFVHKAALQEAQQGRGGGGRR